MLDRLVECPSGARLKALGCGRAGEVRLGRFLRNPKVKPEEMIQTARAGTLARVAGRHILAIQDTTSLHDASNTTRQSLHLHPTIAVDAADGALLGLVDAVFLHRSGGKRGTSNARAFANKESRRWLDATVGAAVLAAAGAACVTTVMDREGDIYEEFALRPADVEVVVRSRHDRMLANGTMLSQCFDGVAELGRETVELPSGAGRRARTIVLALRACPVRIKAPKRVKAGTMPAEVALWCVQAREVDPPDGVAPACWLLLTTHAVPDLAAARQITGFYRQRWTIEQLFRTMKTKGFDIEASQVEEGGPFENLATAVLIASVQVLQMVRERDGTGGRPMSDAFDPADQQAISAIGKSLEGRTVRQTNPHPPGTLAWTTWICARLGGWNCYYDKPGPITVHRGLLQLRTMMIGWRLRTLV